MHKVWIKCGDAGGDVRLTSMPPHCVLVAGPPGLRPSLLGAEVRPHARPAVGEHRDLGCGDDDLPVVGVSACCVPRFLVGAVD